MTPKGFIIMKVTQKLNMTHEMEMTLKLSISITAVTTLFPNAFTSVVDIKGIKKPPYLPYCRLLKTSVLAFHIKRHSSLRIEPKIIGLAPLKQSIEKFPKIMNLVFFSAFYLILSQF